MENMEKVVYLDNDGQSHERCLRQPQQPLQHRL